MDNETNLPDKVFSWIFWIRIVMSPTILGIIIGGITWLAIRGPLGKVCWAAIAMLGLACGIWLAEKARKGKGTIAFMGKNLSTPELEKVREDK